MNYQFFRYPEIDAAVGLAVDAGRLAVHFVAQGGTADGEARNPERREAFRRILEGLTRLFPEAPVLGAHAGRSTESWRMDLGELKSSGGSLDTLFRSGGNFRFDMCLEVGDGQTAVAVADSLRLNPGEDRGPVAVVWPGSRFPLERAARGESSDHAQSGAESALDEARVRDIVRVLCRVDIPRGQLVLYKMASISGAAGFTSTRMREAVQYGDAQFRGLMAAFATRINRTPRETYPTC